MAKNILFFILFCSSLSEILHQQKVNAEFMLASAVKKKSQKMRLSMKENITQHKIKRNIKQSAFNRKSFRNKKIVQSSKKAEKMSSEQQMLSEEKIKAKIALKKNSYRNQRSNSEKKIKENQSIKKKQSQKALNIQNHQRVVNVDQKLKQKRNVTLRQQNLPQQHEQNDDRSLPKISSRRLQSFFSTRSKIPSFKKKLTQNKKNSKKNRTFESLSGSISTLNSEKFYTPRSSFNSHSSLFYNPFHNTLKSPTKFHFPDKSDSIHKRHSFYSASPSIASSFDMQSSPTSTDSFCTSSQSQPFTKECRQKLCMPNQKRRTRPYSLNRGQSFASQASYLNSPSSLYSYYSMDNEHPNAVQQLQQKDPIKSKQELDKLLKSLDENFPPSFNVNMILHQSPFRSKKNNVLFDAASKIVLTKSSTSPLAKPTIETEKLQNSAASASQPPKETEKLQNNTTLTSPLFKSTIEIEKLQNSAALTSPLFKPIIETEKLQNSAALTSPLFKPIIETEKLQNSAALTSPLFKPTIETEKLQNSVASVSVSKNILSQKEILQIAFNFMLHLPERITRFLLSASFPRSFQTAIKPLKKLFNFYSPSVQVIDEVFYHITNQLYCFTYTVNKVPKYAIKCVQAQKKSEQIYSQALKSHNKNIIRFVRQVLDLNKQCIDKANFLMHPVPNYIKEEALYMKVRNQGEQWGYNIKLSPMWRAKPGANITDRRMWKKKKIKTSNRAFKINDNVNNIRELTDHQSKRLRQEGQQYFLQLQNKKPQKSTQKITRFKKFKQSFKQNSKQQKKYVKTQNSYSSSSSSYSSQQQQQ